MDKEKFLEKLDGVRECVYELSWNAEELFKLCEILDAMIDNIEDRFDNFGIDNREWR